MNFTRLFSVFLLLPALALAAPALTPQEVIAQVKAAGAPSAVRALWGNEAQRQALLAGVASGQADWISAAKAIKPGTDAGSAEELADALSQALLRNPYGLLPWLRQEWWQGNSPACLFAYDSELPGGVAEYIGQLQAALAKPATRSLRSLRKECLEGLRQSRQALKEAPQ